MSLASETSLISPGLDARSLRRAPAMAGAPAGFRYVVAGLARGWRTGDLTFVLPTGREAHIKGPEPGPSGRLVVQDFAFMRRILRAGVIGFAEGYIAGEWDSPDLAALLESGAAIELVDVRTEQERAVAVIDGSRLLDQAYHDALLLRDRETPIVFQCHHGIRSQHAAEYFRREGFRNLYNLLGGIDAWSALVDPSVPRY